MVYNKIHDRYDVGLGLCFQFKFNHVEFGRGFTVVSNIPEIGIVKLKANNTYDAIKEVCNMLHPTICIDIIEYDFEAMGIRNVWTKESGMSILNYSTNSPIQAINLPSKEEAEKILDKFNKKLNNETL